MAPEGGGVLALLSCSRLKDVDQKALYLRNGQLLVGDPDADNCCAGERPGPRHFGPHPAPSTSLLQEERQGAAEDLS